MSDDPDDWRRIERLGRWADVNVRRLVSLHRDKSFLSEFYDSIMIELGMCDRASQREKVRPMATPKQLDNSKPKPL